MSGKKVLDLGCSVGGETVAFAERWHVKSISGIDVNELFVIAATMFSSSRTFKEIDYSFKVGYGESIPFQDSAFDFIVSRDVLEHVNSLEETLKECRRILKPKGKMFCVFPSYFFPFNGAHLVHVTKAPAIQWFFDSKALNIAFNEMISARGAKAYWYRPKEEKSGKWKTLYAGIGINGTTFKQFREAARKAGFASVKIIPTPLLAVSDLSVKHPLIYNVSQILNPLLKRQILEDYLSHRIVSVLTA